MKERGNNQSEEKVVHLPPVWCGSICRNAMNELCIEQCAVDRDCSGFEPKQNLKIEDMPRFPLRESASMTKEEKYTSVTIYLSKVVDHLKGVDDEPVYAPIRRQDTYRARSVSLSEDFKMEDLLSQSTQSIPSSETASKQQNFEDDP